MDRGEAEGIQEHFRRVTADDLGAIVEQATARRVRAYIFDTDLAEQVSSEVSLLGASLENISRFESADDIDGTGGP